MLHPTIPLRESLPGIELLPGQPTIDLVGGPVCRHLDRTGECSWAALGAMTPQDILDLSHMGEKRRDALISNVVGLLGSSAVGVPEATGDEPLLLDAATFAAFREIASWALSKGTAVDLLGAIAAAASDHDADAPRRAVEQLRSVEVEALADPAIVQRYDPVANAHALIDSFDERQRAILERILDLDKSAPTLERVGAEFGVTPQRILQIEVKVRARLEAASTSADHLALVAAANRLSDRLGAAVPLVEIKRDFAEFPPDLVDRLLLHLAGPYRIRGDWVLHKSIDDDLQSAVLGAFESVSDAGWAPCDALFDALDEMGVRVEYHAAALDSTSRLHRFDDVVVDWRGSMADKAERILGLRGEAMTAEELVDAIGAGSEASLTGQLSSDRFTRVGPGRYALSSWDMAEYRGIVHAMVQRVAAAGRPLDVGELAMEIHREYGASPNSVKILASTHPAFLLGSGHVAMRTPDQPYRPTQQLGETPRCYLVDGTWVWRYPVDHDVLRGSGRAIPESVAVHLGLAPLQKHRVSTPYGDLGLSWWQQPTMGSTRAAARHLEADEGDELFLMCRSTSAVEFRLLRRDELAVDPSERLCQLVGSARSRSVDEVLADALGLEQGVGGARGVAEVRERLLQRREHDLVELLDQL